MASKGAKIALVIAICLVLILTFYFGTGGQASILGFTVMEGESEAPTEEIAEDASEPEPVEEPIEEEVIEEVPEEIVEETASPANDSESVEEPLAEEAEQLIENDTTEEELANESSEVIEEPNETIVLAIDNDTIEEPNETVENDTVESNASYAMGRLLEPLAPEEITKPIINASNITEQNITAGNDTPITINDSLLEFIEEPAFNTTNITIMNGTLVTDELLQYDAVINQPVRWKRTIRTDGILGKITAKIHKDANNIMVTKEISGQEWEVDPWQVKKASSGVPISGLATYGGDYDIKASWLAKAWYWFKDLFAGGITGNAIFSGSEYEDLKIEESFEMLEITYETPGPELSVNKNSVDAWRITVSSDIHYIDSLAYVGVPEGLKIKVYHLVNDTKILIESSLADTNSDGSSDRVLWTVPHLSEQEYEIILVSDAEHLDENRTFIANVYNEVKDLDNVWIAIPAGDYMRVTFEENLSATKDITVYARSAHQNASIEVYEVGNETKLINFGKIGIAKDYRVLLTDLIGTQDTFDLRVINGVIDFDYIVDPVPTHDNPYLNTTDYPLNTSNANLTCWNRTTADGDGDEVINIYNWYKDEIPLMTANWPFETDNSVANTDTLDYSGRGNDITLKNDPAWTALGEVGGAYVLDGGNDYLANAALSFDTAPAITMELWVNPSGNSGRDYIFSLPEASAGSNGQDIRWEGTNFELKMRTHSATSDTFITAGGTGTWYHLALTYDGTTARAYKNGAEFDNDAVLLGTGLKHASGEVNIGRFGSFGSYFNGLVDEVRLYDYALTAEQVYRRFIDTKDGYNSNQSIVAKETEVEENYICEMTPNDETGDGITKNSTSLSIDPNLIPTHSNPYLNATDYALNTSNANLTCWNRTTADGDGEAVTNIFNWYEDDVSIMTLYAPFDTEEDSLAADAILDYSSRENHLQLGGGIALNSPTWTDLGKVGGAYDFDGVNDYIANSTDITDIATTHITVSAWFKADTLGTVQKSLVEKAKPTHADPYYQFDMMLIDTVPLPKRAIWIVTVGGVDYWYGASNVFGYVNWHHVVGTYNNSAAILYLDGIEIARGYPNAPAGGAMAQYDTGIYIGAFRNLAKTAANCFNGKIDDVRIYDQAFTAAQIRRLYNDTRAGYSYNQTIVSDETSGNDRWTCELTPSDAVDDGITKNSTELAINPPTHTTPYLNATDYPGNLTEANLTCWNQTTADPDGDYVTNIFNWYKDGVPFMALNMPFDTYTDSTADNKSEDYSSNENHGTLNGDTSWLPGNVGGAYTLDGANDYIEIAHDSSLNLGANDFTVSFWMKSTTIAFDTLLSKADDAPSDAGSTGWQIQTKQDNNGIRMAMGDGIDAEGYNDVLVAGNPTDGAWHHIVIALDRTADIVNSYMDGELDTQSLNQFADIDSTDTAEVLRLGVNSYNLFNDYAGDLDDVRMYKTLLDGTQVKRMYEDAKNSHPSNDTITSDLTAAGEEWECQIAPNDGTSNGLLLDGIVLEVVGGGDATKPYTNYDEHNATVATSKNDMVNWSAKISDGVALDYFHFRHNGTADASWVNDTITAASDIAGSPVFIQNQTKIKATHGDYVCGEFYFNDTSNNWNHTGYTWNASNCFTLGKYIAIAASSELAWIQYGTLAHNTDDNAALKNVNGTDKTEYNIDVSDDTSVNVDFCIKGDDYVSGSNTMGRGNNTWDDDLLNNAMVPTILTDAPLTGLYVKGTANVVAGGHNYYRFWLDLPDGQVPGTYQNTVYFKAVQNGVAC